MLWRRRGDRRWHGDARVWRARCVTLTLWALMYGGLVTAWEGWHLSVWSVGVVVYVLLALWSAVMWRWSVVRRYRTTP